MHRAGWRATAERLRDGSGDEHATLVVPGISLTGDAYALAEPLHALDNW
jgi:hypothetical protein